MVRQHLEHQREREGSMHEDIAMALDRSSVCGIEVQQVGVVRGSRIAEEKRARRRQGK